MLFSNSVVVVNLATGCDGSTVRKSWWEGVCKGVCSSLWNQPSSLTTTGNLLLHSPIFKLPLLICSLLSEEEHAEVFVSFPQSSFPISVHDDISSSHLWKRDLEGLSPFCPVLSFSCHSSPLHLQLLLRVLHRLIFLHPFILACEHPPWLKFVFP